jgi:hypothetical protein
MNRASAKATALKAAEKMEQIVHIDLTLMSSPIRARVLKPRRGAKIRRLAIRWTAETDQTLTVLYDPELMRRYAEKPFNPALYGSLRV